MPKYISHATLAEPSALSFKTGGRLARKYEWILFTLLMLASYALEIAAAILGSMFGGASRFHEGTVAPFLAVWGAAFLQTVWMMATAPRQTVSDRIAYLNLACRFQRLCIPTALIGMITWAVAYRFRDQASSPSYWIIFLVVWISNTVFALMNVYNNISWESDLIYQLAPEYPQGNFWLGVLGIRRIGRRPYQEVERKVDMVAEAEMEAQRARERDRERDHERDLERVERDFNGREREVELEQQGRRV